MTIAGKLHFRFKDRATAAGVLGESMKDKINKDERKGAIVLAIPRGGVISVSESEQNYLAGLALLFQESSQTLIITSL